VTGKEPACDTGFLVDGARQVGDRVAAACRDLACLRQVTAEVIDVRQQGSAMRCSAKRSASSAVASSRSSESG
jgi:hypothetical protein